MISEIHIPSKTTPMILGSISWLMTAYYEEPGGWFNIKRLSYHYRKSHCGDNIIWWPSYLHRGISYIGKMTSLYWIRAQGIIVPNIDQGWESINHFPPLIFSYFHGERSTVHLLQIMSIYDRCRHSIAVKTPVKYEQNSFKIFNEIIDTVKPLI